MIPTHFFEHDKKIIEDRLSELPYDLALKACEAYSAVYVDAFDAEPVVHKKINRARFSANSRLREYVENYKKWRSGA